MAHPRAVGNAIDHAVRPDPVDDIGQPAFPRRQRLGSGPACARRLHQPIGDPGGGAGLLIRLRVVEQRAPRPVRRLERQQRLDLGGEHAIEKPFDGGIEAA